LSLAAPTPARTIPTLLRIMRPSIGTLTLNILKSVHTLISPIILYKLYSVATPEHPKYRRLKNRVRIVALTLNLQRVSFCSAIDPLYYSFTTIFLLPLILIKGFIGALRPLINIQEIVISLVAAVACRFIQDRQAGQYLGLKRVTILVSVNNPAPAIILSPPLV
jgi:hypothetical protein